jgi:hypothetical protein
MTDTDRMVVWLRETLDRAEQIARIIDPGGYAPQTWHVMPSRSRRWAWVYSKSRLLGEPPEAAAREDEQPVAIVRTGRNEHLHIAGQDPDAVLRRIAADRKILAEHADDGYGDCKRCADNHDGDCECGTVSYSGYHLREQLGYPCATIRNLAEGWGWTEENADA